MLRPCSFPLKLAWSLLLGSSCGLLVLRRPAWRPSDTNFSHLPPESNLFSKVQSSLAKLHPKFAPLSPQAPLTPPAHSQTHCLPPSFLVDPRPSFLLSQTQACSLSCALPGFLLTADLASANLLAGCLAAESRGAATRSHSPFPSTSNLWSQHVGSPL